MSNFFLILIAFVIVGYLINVMSDIIEKEQNDANV